MSTQSGFGTWDGQLFHDRCLDIIRHAGPEMVSFVVAVAACHYIGAPITLRLCNKLASIARKKFDIPVDDPYGKLGELFGKIERVLFLYAIMSRQTGLFSAWMILKAFFEWTKWSEEKDIQDTKEESEAEHKGMVAEGTAEWRERKEKSLAERLARYHLYIGGSLISILVGIAFGELGRVLMRALDALIAATETPTPT